SNRDLCMGEFNKYRILMRQGKGEEFVDEIGAAIENCEQVQLPISALFLRFDQIRYQFSLKTTNDRMAALSAVERLKSLKLAVDDTQYKNLRVYYHALLSHVLWIANQNVEALSYAKLALNENASIGESEQLLIALNVLVEISFEEQLIEQAYDYLVQKSQVEKSIYQKKLASQVAYYRVKHANLAQELEIEQLNQSNKVLLLEKKLSEQEAKKQQLLIMLVISLFMALAVWAFRIKRKHDYFKQVADIDHLTQVFTRKAFEERMKELLTDCSEQNLPLNLAIMDLDHFKKVNDLYGHLVGDWVLRNVILVCEEVADQDILIARLGGEEFSIVCPGISQDTMMKLMERMRVAIEIMDCRESGADFNITASFGVSSTVLSGYRISSLLTHADLALFEAKNKGRNKVYSFAMMDQNINSAD
ncbi:MAG: GGDEF domain-containing protein, partial [Marinicella sp.]